MFEILMSSHPTDQIQPNMNIWSSHPRWLKSTRHCDVVYEVPHHVEPCSSSSADRQSCTSRGSLVLGTNLLRPPKGMQALGQMLASHAHAQCTCPMRAPGARHVLPKKDTAAW